MAFKNVSSGLTSIVWWAQKWKLFTWILDSAPVKSTLDYWLAWQAKHIMTTSRCWWTRPSSTTGVLCDLEHLANGFVLLTVHVHIEKSRLAPSFFFTGIEWREMRSSRNSVLQGWQILAVRGCLVPTVSAAACQSWKAAIVPGHRVRTSSLLTHVIP